MALAAAHARARERGVSLSLYRLARVLLTPPLRLWFRIRVTGMEHVPRDGPAILAPNHKSFLDPLFVGLVVRRPVRYMAKVEMFRGRLAGLLLRLGAFPVRRGEADADAVDTACAILREGGLVVVFPEGTRVDERDALGSPHHGAGRLALETGAPIVPVAIKGTADLWIGPIPVPRPRVVRIAFLPPVEVTDGALGDPIDDAVWPAVQREYGRLAHRPPRMLGYVEPRRVRRHRR